MRTKSERFSSAGVERSRYETTGIQEYFADFATQSWRKDPLQSALDDRSWLGTVREFHTRLLAT